MATIQLNLNKRQFVGLVRSMSEEDRLELYRELRRSLFVSRFDRLLESLRTDELTMDEITREVESVRQQRYEEQKAAESDKDSRLSQLFGVWNDGPTAEEVIDEIRNNRTSGVTRDITPLDE